MALAIALSVAPAAIAEHYEGTIELQGATPVEAAVAFSRAAFPDGAPEAALGRDDNFADSLASGVLQNNAPLLLTPTASLAPATSSELKRLAVKTVHILGGPSAVSPAVEQQLVAAGYTVRRHRGATRIDTAVAIARAIVPSASEVLIARAFGSGEDATQAFADSLAAGAWSASSGNPVLLTETEKLSAPTQAYLQSNKPAKAYVVGGTSAIGEAVLVQIRALGIEAERVSGATRFDTAIEIAKRRGIDDATDTNDIVLLEGQAAGSWAPGFAAAAYAAVERAPVLLASGTTLPASTSAYLDAGDRELGLLCAPQLAAGACDAAAKLLEKRLAPQVKLNEATVAQYGNVTGTATPAEEILSMTASGCGLTDREVVVNQDGTFTTRIEGAPGTCTLVFTVTTRNMGDITKSIPLTVTEPGPAVAVPELVKVETASTGAAFATVRFVFSEIVRATSYEGAGAISATQFLLYGPQGATKQRFPGSTAASAVKPRRDPANNRAVLVDFERVQYDQATTAAVLSGAAEDLDSHDSILGSSALKPVQLAAGRTDSDTTNATDDSPDLLSAGSITALNMPAGRFRATFTYDVAPTGTNIPAPTAFGLVLADGRVIPGKEAAPAGTTFSVTFAVADTRTPEGTTCSDTSCPTVQQAMSGVRRAYVEGVSTRPLQTVKVGDGVTTRPDLVGVALDTTGGKADFTFDEAISTVDAAKFGFFTVSGQQIVPTEAAVISERVVRVTAPVSKLVVGATVATGGVTGSTGQSATSGTGLEQSFAAGEIVGPALESARAVFSGAGSTSSRKKWQITWTFSQAIQTPDFTKLRLINSTGVVQYQQSAGPADALVNCTVVQERNIQCDIDLDNTIVPALAVVMQGAVKVAGPVSGTTLENIEKSVRL